MSVRLPFVAFIISLLCFNHVQLAYISLENDWNNFPIRQQSPVEQMVDVVNNLGLNVLECHNIDNQNNIAFSPYGLTTVMIALYEGVTGEARFQIKRMARFPNDIDIVRVGFRDIHRLLRSYFIPQEGFLAGLSLNNNVTFSKQYINILKFYGYDVDPNFTTQRPITTVIVPDQTIGTSPMTTSNSDTTTIMSTFNTEPVDKTTTEKITTSPDIASTESTETTSNSEMNTTIVLDTRFDDSDASTVTTSVTETTRVSTSTESNTELTSKLQAATTDTDMKTTEMMSTSIGTTTDMSTKIPDETTTEMKTTITTTNTVSLKTETTEYVTTAGTTITSTEQTSEETTTAATTVSETTTLLTTEVMSTTENPTTVANPTTTENPSTETTTINEVSSEITDESETGASSTVTTTEITNGQTSTESPESTDENDPDMDIAESIISPSAKASITNKARGKRSFVDYLIARYYDNHGDLFNFQHPYITVPPALEKQDNAFLVNGFEDHYDVNYTDFNGVLPFAYVPTIRSMALRFPLDSDRYYLLIILPINPQGVNTVICDLRKFESLRNIIAHLKDTKVKASIPSFMLNGFVILTSTLQKLGVHNVFEPGHADFSPMTDNKNTYVTNIEQAVTVNIRNYMEPKPDTKKRHYNYQTVEFKAVHPFLYFIMDSELNVSLMAGKILNPLNSRIQ